MLALRLPGFLGRRLWRFALAQSWPAARAAARAYRRTLGGQVQVVAVIGSFGKTTATRMVAAALGTSDGGSGNAFTAVPLALLRTPPWRRFLVKEVGIGQPGQMIHHARTLQPDLVVITSIGSEHNRSLGPLEAIAAEKARMLEGLRRHGTVLANGDDAHVRAMLDRATGRVVTFGFAPDSDVRCTESRLDWPRGTIVACDVMDEPVTVRSRLFGRAAVYPVLAALAAARLEGVPLGDAARRLAAVGAAPERLEPMPLDNGAWLVCDTFKGAVETFESAIELLAEIPGRRLAVVGEIENPLEGQGAVYRRLGARLAAIAERTVVVGGRKVFLAYRSGARQGGGDGGTLVHAGESAHAAAEILRPELRAGDVVLLKGAGRQRLQRIALLLAGRTVACRLVDCRAPARITCATCPWRERTQA